MNARLAALGILFALGACAGPEQRLRVGLIDAGLSAGLSACMAADMTPRLSLQQLLRLRDLSRTAKRDRARMTIGRYLHQVRALGDGQIWSIASTAAARCALSL
jgi:hypothetical protein